MTSTTSSKLISIPTATTTMELLDKRLWPTSYTMNRLRQELSVKLDSLIEPSPGADKIFTLLQKPRNVEHGQFALACPALRLPGSPVNVAKELASKFPRDKWFTGVMAEGPFLNFSINVHSVMRESIDDALKMKLKFGYNKIGAGRRVMVEYSSPNIAKPFHAGHLRSTVIGNFLKHIYDANGFETISLNYLGDWGKQYGMLVIGYERFGDAAKLEEDPIKHLYDVYVKINAVADEDASIHDQAREYFKKMEGGDEEALKLWRQFSDLSIRKYTQIYDRLNVKFDHYTGESFYEKMMPASIKELKDKGLLEESKGAQVIDLESEGLGQAIVVKADGTTIYLTRDIASAQYRFDHFGIEKCLYVIAMQQDHHMKQLIATMHKLEKPFANNMKHINFGMVKGMKTRKGQVTFLEDILDEAQEVMHSVMRQNPDKYAQVEDPERVADVLAVSAIVVQDMAARRIKDYDFKIERVTKFEGDTGPYLQYAHSRLCSIERKSGLVVDQDTVLDYNLLSEAEAINLALTIAQWPDIVQEARLTCEPSNIVSYLMGLAREVSGCLDRLWVMGQDDEAVSLARLALYKAARYTLGTGLCIIGLVPLERM